MNRQPRVDQHDVRRLLAGVRDRGHDITPELAAATLILPQLSDHELWIAAGILFPEETRDPPPPLLDPSIPWDLRADAFLARAARLTRR